MIRKMMGEELIKELSGNKSVGSSKDAANLIDIDMNLFDNNSLQN